MLKIRKLKFTDTMQATYTALVELTEDSFYHSSRENMEIGRHTQKKKKQHSLHVFYLLLYELLSHINQA